MVVGQLYYYAQRGDWWWLIPLPLSGTGVWRGPHKGEQRRLATTGRNYPFSYRIGQSVGGWVARAAVRAAAMVVATVATATAASGETARPLHV